MRLAIITTKGNVDIDNLPDDEALDLAQEIQHGSDEWLTFELDESVTTIIARRHIVRFDMEPS